jgi:DNA-binding NtrC family response regulator
MKHARTILITDRNPHVRTFLKREMAREGYDVHLAATGEEALKLAFDSECIDLLILDPDLPGVNYASFMEAIQNRIPSLPVVVHGLSGESSLPADSENGGVFVKKDGNSIVNLKRAVRETLGKSLIK